MNNRFWAKTSLVASVIALGVSIIALANRCPTESATGHISFDYMGVILGILALLVTALIGAQVGQYIFVDRKIEDTAGKIARIIAHKSANNMAKKTAEEIADSIARETASNVSKTVSEEIADKAAKEAKAIAEEVATNSAKLTAKSIATDTASSIANSVAKQTATETANSELDNLLHDIRVIARTSIYLYDAKTYRAMGLHLLSVHSYMFAVQSYMSIENKKFSSLLIEDVFEQILNLPERYKKDGCLVVYRKYRDGYQKMIADTDCPSTSKIQDLLSHSISQEDEELDGISQFHTD